MLNNALRNLLENETVRNYLEALEAMQSPEIIALFRELPPSIRPSDSIHYATDFIQENADALSEDKIERISEFALVLQDKFPVRPWNVIDFRKIEHDLVANNDLFVFLYGLNTIDNMLSSEQLNSDEYETAKMDDDTIRPAVTKEAVVNAVTQAVKSANTVMKVVQGQLDGVMEIVDDASDKILDLNKILDSDDSVERANTVMKFVRGQLDGVMEVADDVSNKVLALNKILDSDYLDQKKEKSDKSDKKSSKKTGKKSNKKSGKR